MSSRDRKDDGSAPLRSDTLTLKSGETALLRPARPGDEPKIRRAFGLLGAETRYRRFLGYKTQVADADLARITGVDFVRDAAYLVTVGEGADEIVVGGASYFALDDADPPLAAEVAFTIEEDFQGKGLATALMRRLAEAGRCNRVGQFVAEVLPSNHAMLSVFKNSGLPMKIGHEDGLAHVVLELAGG